MSLEQLQNLESAVSALLARDKHLTPERIRERIREFRVIPTCSVTDEEADALARRLEARHDVTMTIGPLLVYPRYTPWLEQARVDFDFYYWHRYRQLLDQKGFSSRVISTLHADTDRTLGLLEDPRKEGPWHRRGMVVGHVQSGKTANYIGLICKAADAGYRLIVVIAGVHNNLRNQTQKRIDEGLVGRDSARLLTQREESRIGVGNIDARRRPVTFTNSVRDFSKEMATGVGVPLHGLREPAVFVIKKNSSTLKNLLEWVREHNASLGGTQVDAPMLLIDDEADNASINVRYGQGEVSKINGQLRDLLQMFSRSCYVGYTATPFANIFIDPDTDDAMRGEDLFPRDFIVSLDPPSNYFGATQVFLDPHRPVVRHIEDNEDTLPISHPKDYDVGALPASLLAALRCFVVARAIRLHRGQTKEHCSMLINASRFTGVQSQLSGLVQEMLANMQASVRINAALPAARALQDSEIAALQQVWDDEYANGDETWPEVQAQLLAAAAPIKVVEVNSQSHGTLNYDEYNTTGLSVIAIGGYALSRGLTLEGLMVSYFLRNSMMYDTLMQMGRWFGYRPGYEDLCRVWMPDEAEGWYTHVAESIEMLREELRTMSAAGATPEEFGLKVRAHPDTLIVTARNKMGSGERIVVNIGLGKEFVETATLKNDPASLEANRRAVQHFVRQLRDHGLPVEAGAAVPGGLLLQNVPVNLVRTFLGAFVNHPLSMLTDTGPVGRYIEEREGDELALWDVLFAGIKKSGDSTGELPLGVPINWQTRTAGNRSDITTLRITNKQRVASRGIEKTGLSPADALAAEEAFRTNAANQRGDNTSWNYPDKIYRERRERPLLVIHLLRVLDPHTGAQMHEQPVVAWGISFPATQRSEKRVEYVVTTTWLRETFRADADDEDLDGDDGG